MDTFYIDPDSATNGVGSLADPFNAWASVTWTAGNTYLQKAGTTFAGQITVGETGSSGSVITLGTYGDSGERVISGPRAAVDATGEDYCVYVDANKSYVDISGLELYGATLAGVKKDTTANSTTAAAYVRTTDCLIHDIYSDTSDLGHGLLIYGAGNEVRRCTIHTISTDAVISFGDALVVEHCNIYNVNTQGAGNSGDCISAYDGNSPYIAHNTLDTTNATPKQAIIVRDTGSGSTGGTVEYNVCTMPGFVATSGNGGKCVMVEQANVTIRYNTVTGGEFGIWMQKTGINCYSNLVIAGSPSLDAVIAIRANSISVIGNTLIGEGLGASGFGYGVSHNSTYTSVLIENNLIIGFLRAIRTASSGATENYNWLFDNTQPVVNSSNVNKAAGANTTIGTDPLLSGYRPLPDSPLIGAGTHISYSRDIEGKQRPNPPSIGAYDVATLRRVLSIDPGA